MIYLQEVLKYFTKKELAKVCGVDVRTVNNWVNKGNFPERFHKAVGFELKRIRGGKK